MNFQSPPTFVNMAAAQGGSGRELAGNKVISIK